MKKLMSLLLVCVGLLVTSFTVLPTNLNSSSSTTFMDTLKVTWDIGGGGEMTYLAINDTVFVSNVRGIGAAYKAVSLPFSQTTAFTPDPGYIVDDYDVIYNVMGMVLSATATFIPLL